MAQQRFRIEKDSMGEMQIPEGAYWGAQTQRAIENFPVSGLTFPRSFIRALGMVKMAGAMANMRCRLLPEQIGEPIVQAAREVMEGKLDRHFPVDVFQTGSGTSTNMNANEVIANRAAELPADTADKPVIRSNDHVNLGQSSNDVIPTCMHIAAAEAIHAELLPSLGRLSEALDEKARQFKDIMKIGRTHLQDATPVTLGQEFSGYASMVRTCAAGVRTSAERLYELALGGTAVGTGINTHPSFAAYAIEKICEITGLPFREADNHFEAQAARGAVVQVHGALRDTAVALTKVANDIRWLGSGPRCGIGELILPALQPGSSIMPGKVNPVMAEMVCQVAARVIGNDATVCLGGLSGNFELNVMMPVMAHALLESIGLLSRAAGLFADRCVAGIKANEPRCSEAVEKSLAMVTALSPVIGYNAAADVAQEALRRNKTIREVAMERQLLPLEEINKILDPSRMI
jgi:fumarate hydratase class II